MRFYDLDIDVKNYAKRIMDAGYRCPSDINSVSDFVKGLKILNLYSNLIDIWFMRDNQNAGSGSNVYSFRNSRYNATLVNSPTWHSNGIRFTTTQYAFSLINNLDQDVTLVFVGAGNGGTFTGFGQVFGVQNNNGNIVNGEIRLQDTGGGGTQFTCSHRSSSHLADRFAGNIANPLNNSQNYTMLAGSASINTILNIRNLNAGTSSSGTSAGAGAAALNRMQVNGRFNNSNPTELTVNITSSLCMIFSPQIDFATNSIYNLYKNTAGKGLNLP